MHLVLVGPTGSGKTSLARELEARLGAPRISSGDVAREMSEADTATRLALQQGAMAPEAAMRVAIKARMDEAEERTGGWILDGFPRTIEQLICLLQWSSTLPSFFFLDVPTFTCVERLCARKRPDDNPDSIARKLESFNQKTRPMIDVVDQVDMCYCIRPGTVEGVAHLIESMIIP